MANDMEVSFMECNDEDDFNNEDDESIEEVPVELVEALDDIHIDFSESHEHLDISDEFLETYFRNNFYDAPPELFQYCMERAEAVINNRYDPSKDTSEYKAMVDGLFGATVASVLYNVLLEDQRSAQFIKNIFPQNLLEQTEDVQQTPTTSSSTTKPDNSTKCKTQVIDVYEFNED
jgi:hypothetical protein